MNWKGWTLLLILLVIAGGAWYFLRPVALPSETAQEGVEELDPEANTSLYRISSGSFVEFRINEVLRGSPFTVVGTTTDVAGDIRLNLANPSESVLGTIRINARTIQTDSSQRNGAIARLILKSENAENEFIEFKPTSITGLPESIVVGTEYNFQTTGDLTVSGVTKPVTFNSKLRLVSEAELRGSSESTVRYKDFNLTVPSVPFVANVGEEVILKIEFVANRVES